MKTIFRTLAIAAVLVAAAACQQYKIDTQMTPEKAAASIRMECDALSAYTVPSTNPGTVTFSVSSNTPWTITRSAGADWCTVTPSSSAASALISDVVVSFDDNTTAEDRSVTLTLRGDNVNLPKVITITQLREGALFVTPIAGEYAAAGGPLKFTILTNVDWRVRSDVSWLSFNRESGSPDPEGRTITIIATAEPSTVLERTATITVETEDSEVSFDVSQLAKFSVSAFEDAFAAAGSAQAFILRTDLPWSVSADKTWLSFDKESGEGDGNAERITVTASANDGATRTATVTVEAGDATYAFDVTQRGLSFEIVAPASTELPRLGGEMVIEVNSSLAWEPETDQADWTVTKTDDTHFTVTVPFNNKFVPRSGKVAIVSGTNRAELELTQDVNFTFEGNYEVQDDGSVKLSCGAKSRVVTIDNFRYVKLELAFGDVSFGDKGELWVATSAAGCNIYNQLSLGGNLRIRTDGSLPVSGTSTYKNTTFSITKDELNAMTSYAFWVEPNTETPANHILTFLYNGTQKAQQDFLSVFADDLTASGKYWFGFYNTTSDDTWYVVKSCDITVVEE